MSASFAIVAVEGGSAHVLPASAFTARQRAAIDHIVRHRGVDPLPAAAIVSTAEMQSSAPIPSDAIRRSTLAEAARAQGFSGDICDRCGSPQMKRSGSCLTCQFCGTTTGCS